MVFWFIDDKIIGINMGNGTDVGMRVNDKSDFLKHLF